MFDVFLLKKGFLGKKALSRKVLERMDYMSKNDVNLTKAKCISATFCIL